MEESLKITTFNVENVKRVKAVYAEVPENGLFTIGGKNSQGKTSVLDALTFALCGENYRPTNVVREGSEDDPYIRITMNNGYVVERKGKNTELKVTDPSGRAVTSGQKLLNTFISEFACNIPAFLHGTDKERAKILLKVIGLEDVLSKLDEEEDTLYSERTVAGRVADQKEKFAKELEYYPDAPEAELSASEVSAKLKEVSEYNASVQIAKGKVDQNKARLGNLVEQKKQVEDSIATLERMIEEKRKKIAEIEVDTEVVADELAKAEGQDFTLKDDTEFQNALKDIDAINQKVRANRKRDEAISDANLEREKYDGFTQKIEAIRAQREEILEKADLPYPGLSVMKNVVYLDGKAWDCMSSSQQMTVACAICCRLKPDCGFIFVDQMEKYDEDQRKAFGKWAKDHNMQIIGTRVSTDDENSIIIEDGCVLGQDYVHPEVVKGSRRTAAKKEAVAAEKPAPKPAAVHSPAPADDGIPSELSDAAEPAATEVKSAPKPQASAPSASATDDIMARARARIAANRAAKQGTLL